MGLTTWDIRRGGGGGGPVSELLTLALTAFKDKLKEGFKTSSPSSTTY